MRYVFGFMCVCALGLVPLIGCSETTGDGGSGGAAGDGGSGGTAGDGGSGGTAGDGGSGGMAGVGGSGGMPECQNPEDCDDGEECTTDTCASGVCENTAIDDGTTCAESNECAVGQCASGACELTPVTNGTACGDDAGTCQDGTCEVACNEQGIRDAIAAGGGPYSFDCNGPQTVVTESEIVIDNDVVLDGESELTIDGNESHRVLSVAEEVVAEVRALTVSGGFVAGDYGAGVLNDGTLTLLDVTVSNNTSVEVCRDCTGGSGGGITNRGTLSLLRSTVSGNSALWHAGIDIWSGTTTLLLNSTVSGNSGVISAAVGVSGSTGETTSVSLINSTVAYNDSSSEAWADIYASSSSVVTVTNTLVEGDCAGDMRSNGHNIESPGDTCGFDQRGDQVNVSAEALNLEWFGFLRDNGGPTMTHALGWGSVAIDVIPAAQCIDANGAPLTIDQTDAPRPEMGGTMCDVGAFEFSTCGIGEPDPWQPGEERLSVGIFYECGRSETIFIDSVTDPVDGLTKYYWIFATDPNNPSETLTYTQGTSEDRLEGRVSDQITLLDKPWWGGGVIWFEPIDLSEWTTMFVSFKSSDPSFATFEITLQSGQGEDPPGVSLDPREYGYSSDGEWHFLEIPLQHAIDLGWDPSVVRSPFIIVSPGGEPGDVMLIDNLYFTKDGNGGTGGTGGIGGTAGSGGTGGIGGAPGTGGSGGA